jgi:hypothetical protein
VPLVNRSCCSKDIILILSEIPTGLCYRSLVTVSVHQQNLPREDSKATRWILQVKIGEVSYKDRLLALNLQPLSYDREIKDLTFFFKATYGYYDLNVCDYVSFVSHSRTRNCVNPSLTLKVPLCKTSTFQSSYFNRIVPLWNRMCRTAKPSDLSSLTMFRSFLSRTYLHLLISCYDVDMACTCHYIELAHVIEFNV